ncbi:MAG: PHP domain-containing protein, partial [Saprospiraceae bacterium]
SQAAAYANGLKLEQLEAQWLEIDYLNQKLYPFKILKGIECDILAHGDLDYNEEILSRFELIIGSIHSVFNMDETKATNRLIRAIENPFTNIIGHPSGRLLLSREGYPLDYARILDACKANQVAIELNANPQRLDIDASHITKCVESGVYVAINPDAHNKTSIKDINYGLISARRGALPASLCLNTMTANELISFCKKR